jgi:lysyl-tRNA synthetase class 2
LPTHSETGELSLEIKDIPTLLTPCLHELPASITDEHTLSRFPQLSLVLDQKRLHLLRLRSEMENRLYNYFRDRDFTKVSTPIISTSTGGAVARPFVTTARDFPQQPLSLRIAQELDLKKLIAAGLDRVYELGPVFRNEGTSALTPEYCLLDEGSTRRTIRSSRPASSTKHMPLLMI